MTTTAEAPAVRVERRLLAGPADGRLDTHLAANGRPPAPDATQLIEVLRVAGLTGHGGAGFPAWRKLAAVHATGRPAVVIANGAEGEPASSKDKALLASQPHLVLDGLQLVAGALGARAAYIYVSAASVAGVRAALADRRQAGLDPVAVAVHTAPDAFVSGEESAVVAAISGRPAVPGDKRVRIIESGVGGAPTLVQNVETLAHIAQIVRHGPDWFRSAGTPDEPGTFLATVGGAVAAPGVVEAGYGVRLGDLIDAAGGATERPQAFLVGGYHGGWVPADPDLPVSRAAMTAYGASPGAGIVLALPVGVCGLTETARIAGYLAAQAAGQCGPCVNGLPRLADTLADLAQRRARPGLPAEVERLTALVSGRGACRHPDGTARLIRSGLQAFAADVEAHLAGHCLATRSTTQEAISAATSGATHLAPQGSSHGAPHGAVPAQGRGTTYRARHGAVSAGDRGVVIGEAHGAVPVEGRGWSFGEAHGAMPVATQEEPRGATYGTTYGTSRGVIR